MTFQIPIFDGGVQDVFKEDIWKDGSDGSDSGIDCMFLFIIQKYSDVFDLEFTLKKSVVAE